MRADSLEVMELVSLLTDWPSKRPLELTESIMSFVDGLSLTPDNLLFSLLPSNLESSVKSICAVILLRIAYLIAIYIDGLLP